MTVNHMPKQLSVVPQIIMTLTYLLAWKLGLVIALFITFTTGLPGLFHSVMGGRMQAG